QRERKQRFSQYRRHSTLLCGFQSWMPHTDFMMPFQAKYGNSRVQGSTGKSRYRQDLQDLQDSQESF
ncbi:MAG TPA: hypothetical protein VNO70_18200, partial [Blastocatellia bacterium]|nr:hypothetical protein [Blastocatellia bacterium]